MTDLPAERDRKLSPLEQRAANPLTLVPKDLRKPLSWLWMFYSHLLPSALPIAAQLATWLKRGAITADDLTDIFRRLTEPGRAAGYKFASDLLTDLAGLVAQAQRKRRQAEELEQARATSTPGATSEEWQKFMANLGSVIGGRV